MAAQILATKLFVPLPRPGLVPRPDLLERLWAGCAGKLTLISAPAGFGKTTLLALWLASLASIEHSAASIEQAEQSAAQSACSPLNPPPKAAWLSLDPADNDPARFWIYVASALDRARPGCAVSTLQALDSPQPPAIEAILTELLNVLAALPDTVVLVLDDYHVIENPAIHQALTFLLDHLPPSLRLVLATRVDPLLPLARLRARGELTELRIGDMRFSSEESAAFLQSMVGPTLSAGEVAALEQRTEGWAAGLQLAAIAMRGRADLTGFIAGFTGSSRFVVDYLAAEVLDGLPHHLHSFVMQTSILERLSASLCDAVLGVEAEGAGHSGLLLAELERLNLFLIPLDDERVWFRYHHLFAEVLRGRLRAGASTAVVAELHRRASEWYARQVEATSQPFVADAVQHALAAHDWQQAARLIEGHGLALALRGNVATVLGWLDALPEALFQTRPVLGMNHAVMLVFTNQLEAGEARLRDVERSLPPDADDERTLTTRGQLVLMRANLARTYGDVAASVELSREALAILPPAAAIPRAGSVVNLARGYLATGDVSPAAEHLAEEGVQLQQRAGNQVALLNAITNLAWLRVLQGRLGAAVSTYEEGRRAVPSSLQGMGGPAYFFGLGAICYERNDLTAAEQYLEQGLRVLASPAVTTDALVAAQGYLAVARLRQAQGDHAAALGALALLGSVAPPGRGAPVLERWAAAMRARLSLAQGDLDGTSRWADVAATASAERSTFLDELAQLTLARVWVAQSRRDASPRRAVEAGALLERLLLDALASGRGHSVIEIRVLQSLTLWARGGEAAAIEALAPALELAADEGYVRVFVDEGEAMRALLGVLRRRADVPEARMRVVGRLVDAFGDGEPIAEPGRPGSSIQSTLQRPLAEVLVEPLTARELEVLRLIAEGANNSEIAERLVIAVGTVKRHINSLFGKLAVESRTQALRVARARNLI
jgi:LuxR family maltose regulon positive regulatory protein